MKSITSTMEDNLRDIGIRKHHYIKRKIKKGHVSHLRCCIFARVSKTSFPNKSDENYVDYRNREDLHQDLYHESRPMTASISQIAGKAPTNDFDGSHGTNNTICSFGVGRIHQDRPLVVVFHGRSSVK